MSQSLRAIDQELFGGTKRTDFKSRNHGFFTKSVYELLLAVLGVALGTTILVNLESLLGGAICLVAGVVLLVFSIQTQKSKIKLERSEFLNALFASAIADKTKFSIIVSQKDAQIAYMNQGFQKLFPEVVDMPKRTMTKILAGRNVADAKKKAVLDAIKTGATKTVEVEIAAPKTSKKKAAGQKIKISVQPIAKPSGFCLVRGV